MASGDSLSVVHRELKKIDIPNDIMEYDSFDFMNYPSRSDEMCGSRRSEQVTEDLREKMDRSNRRASKLFGNIPQYQVSSTLLTGKVNWDWLFEVVDLVKSY